jgi:mono/diheme cytochrome c family protein
MVIRAVVGMMVASLLGPVAVAYGADAAAGKQLSVKHCDRCHGAGGKGDGAMLKRLKADVTPVDWTDKAAMAKLKDADLTQVVKEGGKTSGKSKIMPAFKDKLSDAEVGDVVAYIRSLAN